LTSALLAWLVFNTFVDVILTKVTSKTRVLAIALVVIEQIGTMASIAGIVCAFVNVFFAVAAGEARRTSAGIGQSAIDGCASCPILTRLP